jgi:hypothetical protein
LSAAVPELPRALRRSLVAAALTTMAALSLSTPAQAGRLLVTGHDADHHCARDSAENRPGPCHFAATGVNYVRGTAPDPNKPVLVLDRGSLDWVTTLRRAAPGVPSQVVDPRSPEFASLPLTTDAYSAILIGSSKDGATDPTQQDLNEIGSTPDTDAINARAAEIAVFFSAGGGIYVASGGEAGRTDSAKYYRFLNITRGGAGVTKPFSLTPLGTSIGFQDGRVTPGQTNDINCCLTHVSFEPPAPDSALKIAEQDGAGRAVTLVSETSTLADVAEGATDADSVFSGVPGGSTGETTGGSTGGTTKSGKSACVPKKSLRVSLKRPKGVRFSKVTVYINGKVVKKVSRKRLGTKSKTKAFSVKLSQRKTSKVRIVAQTASGRKLTFRQTYKPCR